jgi:hypothetical protein
MAAVEFPFQRPLCERSIPIYWQGDGCRSDIRCCPRAKNQCEGDRVLSRPPLRHEDLVFDFLLEHMRRTSPARVNFPSQQCDCPTT